jgi:hypothetical protein
VLNQPKAIVVAACIIGACLLAHLGYTVLRDRSAAESVRKEQTQRTKAVAESQKRAQSKEAWKQSLKFIDVDFRRWLTSEVKPIEGHIVSIKWEWVKPFDLLDVDWRDSYHVTVHGFLGASAEEDGKKYQVFSWTRNVELKGDGVDTWWTTDRLVFGYPSLTKDQQDQMQTQVIVTPDWNASAIR